MKKKQIIILGTLFVACTLLGGCFNKKNKWESVMETVSDRESTVSSTEQENGVTDTSSVENAELPDGVYTAKFDTDSSMFRVSEACNGKGMLTVENGKMTIHVSLGSKNILNLYPGLAEDAKKEGAELLSPTVDEVTYSDGFTEEVYGFDVPVPVLEEEFDLALIGKKGKWYDHKVCVSNPEPLKEEIPQTESISMLEDGSYTVNLTFEGGSGKAEILSPATVTVSGETAIATIQWSSPNYDYMLVDGAEYLPVNTEGNSVFEIPVFVFDEPMEVIGNTVAMSKPHEIAYTLTFHSDGMKPCGSSSDYADTRRKDTETVSKVAEQRETESGLIYESSMELQYAENFTVDYYEGGYTMLTTVTDKERFLVVPEGKEVPKHMEKDIVVLQRPMKDIYLVASAVMDMFSELDGLDAITFSGQQEKNWYIEVARDAMAKGEILYAGKYNKPDYELMVSKGCTLAIENRMITHAPEVVEKLEEFGIPVMIEYSSYEPHPLGRVEWVKFFGALLGKEAEAQKIFQEQTAILQKVTADEKTDKTVAFFFVTSNGLVQVRQASDYVPKMIELAGGRYVFENLGDSESKRSTMNISIEDFYDGAKEADFLIYNSSIDGGVADMEELLEKCSFLQDFKAVKEKNVWCTTNDMYQQSLSIGYLMEDIHGMLRSEGEEHMRYLFPLK